MLAPIKFSKRLTIVGVSAKDPDQNMVILDMRGRAHYGVFGCSRFVRQLLKLPEDPSYLLGKEVVVTFTPHQPNVSPTFVQGAWKVNDFEVNDPTMITTMKFSSDSNVPHRISTRIPASFSSHWNKFCYGDFYFFMNERDFRRFQTLAPGTVFTLTVEEVKPKAK